MTRTYSLLLGVAIGASLTGLFALIPRPTDRAPIATSSFPDEFYRAAAQLGAAPSPTNQRKTELMRQAAAERQESSVADSGMYWTEYERSLASPNSAESSLELETATLAKLIDFQEQLETALAHAVRVADFERAWTTWEEVDRRIVESRSSLLKRVGDELPEAIPSNDGSNLQTLADHIRQFGSYLKDHQSQLVVSLAAVPPSEALPAPLQVIADRARQLDATSVIALAKARKELGELRERLRDSSNRIDPAKSTSDRPPEGHCSRLLRQTGELAVARQQADFDTWLQLGGDKRHDVSGADPSDELLEVERQANSIRQLAYNLWALREIHAAETVDSWVERLAQIDTGILEPVVAALYSSTYARRLEQVTDPYQRSVVVQQLLGDSKHSLGAF